MQAYKYNPNDGKLHTRYTELMQCSETGIVAVLEQRFGLRKKGFTNNSMEFGKTRHGMFEVESKKTGLAPEVFRKNIQDLEHLDLEFVEESFATELFPNVVVHFTPDSVAPKQHIIVDNKTAVNEVMFMEYFKSKQLTFYAMLLEPHGIIINKGLYLVELWNKDYDEVLGYSKVPKKIGVVEQAEVLSWSRKRIKRLQVGIEYYKNELGLVEV